MTKILLLLDDGVMAALKFDTVEYEPLPTVYDDLEVRVVLTT